MLYALADRSRVITLKHLRSALAVGDYCCRSARILFPSLEEVEDKPDPIWLQLLNAIISCPGISKTELHERLGKRVRVSAIDEALLLLKNNGHACSQAVKGDGAGRPTERWYPFSGERYNLSSLCPIDFVPSAKEIINCRPPVEGDASANACERINSCEIIPPKTEGKELINSFADGSCERINPTPSGEAELIISFAEGKQETPRQERGKGEGEERVVKLTLEEVYKVEGRNYTVEEAKLLEDDYLASGQEPEQNASK
jgi:hypothetical protein